MTLDHVGLNHLSWIREVRVDGEDRLPALIDAGDPIVTADDHFAMPLVRALGAVPSYYLRFYYATDDVLREQLDGASRATDVINIERELLELYRDPSLVAKPLLLEQRGGAYYSEAAAALIESLHTGDGAIHVVDVRNDGAIPNLPPDAVVEVPSRIDRAGAHPLPTAPLAPELLGLVQHVKAYETLVIRAAMSGDDGDALRALIANPLVPAATAPALLDAIIEANLPYLPRFVPSSSKPSGEPDRPDPPQANDASVAVSSSRSISRCSHTSSLIIAILSASAACVLTSRSCTSDATA